MINTFYGMGQLTSPSALFAATIIGFFFGMVLERAGFGSSKKLSGIFYFRDMAVLKVMFTALLTAMIGLNLFIGTGLIAPADQIYFMPTYYGAYSVAGLIFGIGFVMSGWCPGTAAVGLASGKLDALIFLGGGILGSILFNELFPVIKPLYTWGASTQDAFNQPGVAFVYTSLGLSKATFAFLFTVIAVGCFWGAEYIEKTPRTQVPVTFFKTGFLKAFSVILIVCSCTLFIFSGTETDIGASMADASLSEQELFSAIETAADHIEPEELATALYNQAPYLTLVDIRPPAEFNQFHIRGAVNVQLTGLSDYIAQLEPGYKAVLYSNGMTHPAQARDQLYRMGYRNVLILTDGLNGFKEVCLKPASLRDTPPQVETAAMIHQWQAYFLFRPETAEAYQDPGAEDIGKELPGFVTTAWLQKNLAKPNVKVIDSRDQPHYNHSHIPGAVAISCESFRGAIGGVPSIVYPGEVLASKMALLGIAPNDTVVVVYGGDRLRDATLIAMSLERLGHKTYAILEGGFDKWIAEGLPVNNELPDAARTDYPFSGRKDGFTFTYRNVLSEGVENGMLIIDTRPADYYSGQKSDEARAGHIPGAVNRCFKDDLAGSGLKPLSELETAYGQIIKSKTTPVIIHCRTGHQASQTYFVLSHLLKYEHVYWYDAGWTEWAARKELPVKTGS